MPDTVRWVDNQNSRWGSCTPSDRSIRLSTRLQGMPAWVIDYVLVHELAHLIEAGHTPAFWAWVDRYPKAERAKGFLEGIACATQLGLQAGAARLLRGGRPADARRTSAADGEVGARTSGPRLPWRGAWARRTSACMPGSSVGSGRGATSGRRATPR